MYRFCFRVLPVFTLLVSTPVWAQSSAGFSGYVQLNAYAAPGNKSPFWLRTNQWGAAPRYAPAASLRLGLSRGYKAADSVQTRTVDWGGGVELVPIGSPNAAGQTRYQFIFPAAYLKVRVGNVELWCGRRQQSIGLTDTLLSSGSYAVSANALPIPQLQVVLPDFLPLPGLKGVVAIKAGYAHGWFNAPYIQGAMLHHKHVYIRLGRRSSPVHVLAGINHQVQWGGHADYLKNSPVANDGQLTTDFSDYLKSVVLGRIPKELGNSRYTSFDAANRIGNHIGSMDIGLIVDRPSLSWFFYHQHPYDDASGLSWRNAPDGLYGLRWLNKTTGSDLNWHWRRVVGEFLTTTNQSGPYFSRPGQAYKGADNYYNHSQYVEGWSYFGQSLGTPFLIPRPDLAATSEQGEFYFPSNRVVAYYVAFDAQYKRWITVTGRFSYSRNVGSYSTPFLTTENQFSALWQVNAPFFTSKAYRVSIDLAFDRGKLLDNNLGGHIGIRRCW